VYWALMAIPVGVTLTGVALIVDFGWHTFTTSLLHPRVDSNAFDLFAGAVVASVTVLMGLTAATIAAAAAVTRVSEQQRAALRQVVGSPLWFFPTAGLICALTSLAAAAYGFPRSGGTVLAETILGIVGATAFIILNARAAAIIIGAPADAEADQDAEVPEAPVAASPTPAG
jgi:malonyl CoA-acyl carrier protein transacylase